MFITVKGKNNEKVTMWRPKKTLSHIPKSPEQIKAASTDRAAVKVAKRAAAKSPSGHQEIIETIQSPHQRIGNID